MHHTNQKTSDQNSLQHIFEYNENNTAGNKSSFLSGFYNQKALVLLFKTAFLRHQIYITELPI